MKKLFEPQIIFIYNKSGYVINTIFLTYDEENLLETKQFELYQYYLNNTNLFLEKNKYTIIKNHILLTLTIGEIRGYIRHEILKTKLSILLFSIWNNIDYLNKDNSIFNPFDLNNQIYDKVPENTLIYKIYNQVAFNGIFCVIDENNITGEICSQGVYNDKIYKFVNDIMSLRISGENKIEITSELLNNVVFNLQWDLNIIYDLQNLTNVKKIINETYFNFIYLSGNKLILNSNNSDQVETSYIYIYNKDLNNKVLEISNNVLEITNVQEYEKILLLYPKLENFIIKQKLTKQNIRINYNISIKTLVLDYDINFFIELTEKTKNIFLDRSKTINIITSSNHIFFSTYNNIQINLYIYITKIIIALQILKNKANFFIENKKKGSRYYSRYCQGLRVPKKIDITDINLDNYINLNNLYYKHKKNLGDIVYNAEIKQYVMCGVKDIYNVGFIRELYQGYNICLPCCYKKSKENNKIFKNCINNSTSTKEISYDPYVNIFKQYRITINPNKLSLLLDKLDTLFNQNNNNQKIKLNKYNKIISATNYNVYTINNGIIDFMGFETLRDSDEISIYFKNNEMFFNPNLIKIYYTHPDIFLEKLTFYLIIQNKIHIIKTITKTETSEIQTSDVSIENKKIIIQKFFFQEPFVDYKVNKLVETKYLYKSNIYTLSKKSIGYYIVNRLYKKYFDIILPLYDEDIHLYKITFLINLVNVLKININLNIDLNMTIHAQLLKKVISSLNPKFIEINY